MVTEKEIFEKVFDMIHWEEVSDKVSMRVTDSDIKRFKDNEIALQKKLRDKKLGVDCESKSKGYTYEQLAEECQVSASSIKNMISGRQKITREFIYRMAVGLKMSISEANEYFALCGGVLNEDCLIDYICIKALKDHDSIGLFCEQAKKFAEMKLERKERKDKF